MRSMKQEMIVLRIFLDTNVLIDLFAQRKPYLEDAERLLVMREFGDAELWASAKSFTDIFYVLSKHFESSKIQLAFKECFSWLNVCSVDLNDLEVTTDQSWKDFEDCLINTGAEKVKADYLLSRDVSGFSSSKLDVYSPADFFAMLEKDHGLVYDTVGI